MSVLRYAMLLTAAALASCSGQGSSLAGYPGLQQQVISYYNGRAMERSASCPTPEMRAVTSARVVEDTPQRVVMDIRYSWVDWNQAADVGGANVTTCNDWGERTFTFARTGTGTLGVVGMTGEQKRG
jgi:hypothetical protein